MKLVKVAGIKGLDITIDRAALERASDRINDVFKQAARSMVRVAKDRAPYDKNSRHAKSETAFPAVHHRDSIRFGQMVAKKGQTGEANRAMSLAFFGVNGKPLKYAFIRSNSGRGLWLEYGTSGKTGSGDYEVKKIKNARRQARRAKSEIANYGTVREHYATKRQRHFLPGMNAAKKYIKANLKNVL